ncbi:MAG: hypothetical protein PHS02_00215, partial [Candidatus ainarchaeum sp.]|nr:hypothetical protein [Candidatus ainarchaeum sp.]
LISLGVPVECNYTETGNGSTTTLTLKFKGSKIRGDGETVITGQETIPAAFVLLENEYYVKMPSQAAIGPLAGCEWLKVTNSSQASSSGNVDLNPLSDLKAPNAHYECAAAAFGDEVFNVTGTICDLDSILNGITNGTAGNQTYTWPGSNGGDEGTQPVAGSPCDSITDAGLKAECKANCDGMADATEKAECVATYQQF